MTKIAIQPNASGTGVFTLTAPSSNADRTFSLPDATGEVLTDQSNIEAQVKTAANASGSAPIYACRAWVNFDGTSGNILASGNVSSVTRRSSGRYTVNFTTAMPDANYVVSASPIGTNNRSGGGFVVNVMNEDTDNAVKTTTACSFTTINNSDTAFADPNNVSFSIFR